MSIGSVLIGLKMPFHGRMIRSQVCEETYCVFGWLIGTFLGCVEVSPLIALVGVVRI